jgi:iron complex transport system permease protein
MGPAYRADGEYRIRVLLLVLWASIPIGVVLACAVGRFPVSPGQLLGALAGRLWGNPTDLDLQIATILWEIRLPRILAAMIVGASLATAGCTFQSVFRNPLVSPDILGVSAGAGLGAALGITLGWRAGAIQCASFLFGLAAVAVVWRVAASIRAHDPGLVLVLTGIVVGALLGAGTSLLKFMADTSNALPSIVFWMMGSLSSISAADISTALPAMAMGLLPLLFLRWRINLLALGDEEATSLGVDVRWLRGIVVAAATLMTAAAVSISGLIGWIGLIIPHIARLLVGAESSRVLPVAAVLGAQTLLLVDTLARTVFSMEIPIGVLTAIGGAPIFLYLLAFSRRDLR